MATITPNNIKLLAYIAGCDDNVAIYTATVPGHYATVVARISKGSSEPSAEFKMAQLLMPLSPNFIQTYTEVSCLGSEYFFEPEIDRKELEQGKRIFGESHRCSIDKAWGDDLFPPLCYDKPIARTTYIMSQYTGATTTLDAYKVIPLRCMLMEYIPPVNTKHFDLPLAVKVSIMRQVAASLQLADNKYNFEHNDLHIGNILLRPTDEKEITYPNLNVTVPLEGYIAVIIDYEFSRTITPTLVGTRLKDYTESKTSKWGWLPKPALTAPHTTYHDLSILWDGLMHQQPPTLYDMFFDVHGVKRHENNGRVKSIQIPFTNMDFFTFAANPKVYLQEFFLKPTTLAALHL